MASTGQRGYSNSLYRLAAWIRFAGEAESLATRILRATIQSEKFSYRGSTARRGVTRRTTTSRVAVCCLGSLMTSLEPARSYLRDVSHSLEGNTNPRDRPLIEQFSDERDAMRHATRRIKAGQRFLRVGRPVTARF